MTKKDIIRGIWALTLAFAATAVAIWYFLAAQDPAVVAALACVTGGGR